MRILCDKCKSDWTEVRVKDNKPSKPEAMTMSEYEVRNSRMQCVPAVMVYTQYVAECFECGYKHEFTDPPSATTLSSDLVTSITFAGDNTATTLKNDDLVTLTSDV